MASRGLRCLPCFLVVLRWKTPNFAVLQCPRALWQNSSVMEKDCVFYIHNLIIWLPTMNMGWYGSVISRFGPRQIRVESSLVRSYGTTGACPYDSLQVADVGDIPVNPYNLRKTCNIIREHMSQIIADGCRPITLGGDHSLTYPILQAIKVKYIKSKGL